MLLLQLSWKLCRSHAARNAYASRRSRWKPFAILRCIRKDVLRVNVAPVARPAHARTLSDASCNGALDAAMHMVPRQRDQE